MSIYWNGFRTRVAYYLFFLTITAACSGGHTSVANDDGDYAISDLRDTAAIDSLNQLAFGFWAKSIDTLLAYSKQALALSAEINYTKGKIDAYGLLGVAHYQRGEYREAIQYYEQTIDMATDISDFRKVAQLKCDVALSYNAIGAQDEALNSLFSALQICEEHGLKSTRGHVLNNLGMVYHYQKKRDQALTYYQRSRAVYESLGDSSKLTFILGNMAHIHLAKKEYTLAHEYYTISLALAEKYQNNKAIGNALQSLGNIYLETGDPHDAVPYFLRSKEVLESIGEKTEYLRLMVNLANCYSMLEDQQTAFQYARLGYDLALQQEQLWYIHESAGVLSRLYEERDDHKLALDFYKTSRNALDSLNSIQNKEETIRLEEKYKYEKEQRAILSDHEKQIDKRQHILYLVCVLVVALAVITLLLLRNIQQKRKVNGVLEQANKSIEERNLMLQETDEFKAHLISLLAHDLRSPIASVKIALHLFDQGDLSSDTIRKLMISSHTEIDVLSNVVDDLLLWVMAQSKQKRMDKKILNLFVVIQDVISLYEQQARRKGVELRHSVAIDINVCADKETLKIVLRNLLSNALKFCRAGDSTTIVAAKNEKNGKVRISVVDTGVGMTEEIKQRLFSMHSDTRPGTNGEKGTGLGLLICERYVTLNGGKLHVESEFGKGTTFWFTLPTDCEGVIGS